MEDLEKQCRKLSKIETLFLANFILKLKKFQN